MRALPRHDGKTRALPRSIRYRFGDPEPCIRNAVQAFRGRFFASRGAVENAIYTVLGRNMGHTDWSAEQIFEWMLARGILRSVTGFRVPTRL